MVGTPRHLYTSKNEVQECVWKDMYLNGRNLLFTVYMNKLARYTHRLALLEIWSRLWRYE